MLGLERLFGRKKKIDDSDCNNRTIEDLETYFRQELVQSCYIDEDINRLVSIEWKLKTLFEYMNFSTSTSNAIEMTNKDVENAVIIRTCEIRIDELLRGGYNILIKLYNRHYLKCTPMFIKDLIVRCDYESAMKEYSNIITEIKKKREL